MVNHHRSASSTWRGSDMWFTTLRIFLIFLVFRIKPKIHIPYIDPVSFSARLHCLVSVGGALIKIFWILYSLVPPAQTTRIRPSEGFRSAKLVNSWTAQYLHPATGYLHCALFFVPLLYYIVLCNPLLCRHRRRR